MPKYADLPKFPFPVVISGGGVDEYEIEFHDGRPLIGIGNALVFGDEKIAVKRLEPDDKPDQFRHERLVYQRLDGIKGIPKLFPCEKEDEIWMERFYRDLFFLFADQDELCKRITPDIKRAWIGQLLDTLVEIHARGVIHCDLRAHNVVVDDKDLSVRIIDFGISTLDGCSPWGKSGPFTPMTESHTLKAFRNKDMTLPPSIKIDMFAFGSLVFEIMLERVPYQELVDQHRTDFLEQRYSRGEFDLPDELADLKEFVHSCWKLEFEDMSAAREAFRKIEWSAVPEEDNKGGVTEKEQAD